MKFIQLHRHHSYTGSQARK